METEKIRLNPFLLSLFIITAMELTTGVIISRTALSPMVTLGVVRSIEIILLLAILYYQGTGLDAVGLGSGDLWPGIKKGCLWSAGFAVVASAGAVVVFMAGINPFRLIRSPLPGNSFDLAIYFLVGGIVAPVAEEIFFRGFLYGFFRRWGILVALLTSTFIFVLLHGVQTLPVTQIIGGLVFAAAYEIEKRLMVPVVIHVTGNCAIFTISWLL